jgi:hypothetical protein
VPGCLLEDLRSLGGEVAALVAGLHAGLKRDPVGGRAGPAALRVTGRAAAELQHRVVAEDLD